MEEYFNPEREISFPFPSCLNPNRYALDADRRLRFHGRESLRTLFDRVEKFLCQSNDDNFYYVGAREDADQEGRKHCLNFLNGLAAGQYCIRAVSASSSQAMPFSASNQPLRLSLNEIEDVKLSAFVLQNP
jgi:hypothetical protein